MIVIYLDSGRQVGV